MLYLGRRPKEGIEQCIISSVTMPKTLALSNARATIRAHRLRRIRHSRVRTRAIAEYERTTCEVVDEGGNVVFVALAH
nr:MAG TPA: hypothetical protein [Bacteriophage sp.]